MSSSANLYGVAVGTASTGALGLSPIVTVRAPASTDIRGPNGPFKIGQLWVNTLTNASYQLTSFSSSNGTTTATWNGLGEAAGTLNELTPDTGGAVTPSAGNINILGTSGQIITTGSGNTITLSLSSSAVSPGNLEVIGNLLVDGTTTFRTCNSWCVDSSWYSEYQCFWCRRDNYWNWRNRCN